MKLYPSELIRGVANSKELNEEGKATVSLFVFRENPSRNDDNMELSINWCDDKEKALSIIMNQVKEDGSYQFKAGAAVLSKEKIDLMKQSPVCSKEFDYERAPLDNNEFHGNIICNKKLQRQKQTLDLIRSILVLSVTSIISRKHNEIESVT